MNSSSLEKFLLALDEECFYDAHEALEHLWFPRRFEDDDEIRLLKGYINAAVSFELIKRGRKESAKKVYNVYLKYRDLRLHVKELYPQDALHVSQYETIEKRIQTIHGALNDQ